MVGCDAPFILWLDCECHLLRMGAALLHSCSCSEEVGPHSGCYTLFENHIGVCLGVLGLAMRVKLKCEEQW